MDEATTENPLDAAGEARLYQALRRFWHPVMYSDGLGAGPRQVVILGEEIVLVRLGGEVRAFPDLCVHRGTALSLGRVEDGQLRCAYHGWTYGPDGVCTAIPARHGHSIPSRARLRPIRVTEEHGLIWVALEEPWFAAPTLPEFGDARYHILKVPTYDWHCGMARRVENFIDFAHIAWVHDGSIGDRNRPEVPEHEVRREGSELRWEATLIEPPNDKLGPALTEGPVYSQNAWRLFVPNTVWFHQVMPGDLHWVVYIAVSPIGPKDCRTFTFMARNYDFDEDDDKYIRFQLEIAEQDRVVTESQKPEELPVDLSAELHIRGVDKVSLEYRKWLVELLLSDERERAV
jgi:phenylpropionate dioxygenase-like ring-hydroxylating dioxygenase large terminal subunit